MKNLVFALKLCLRMSVVYSPRQSHPNVPTSLTKDSDEHIAKAGFLCGRRKINIPPDNKILF